MNLPPLVHRCHQHATDRDVVESREQVIEAQTAYFALTVLYDQCQVLVTPELGTRSMAQIVSGAASMRPLPQRVPGAADPFVKCQCSSSRRLPYPAQNQAARRAAHGPSASAQQ